MDRFVEIDEFAAYLDAKNAGGGGPVLFRMGQKAYRHKSEEHCLIIGPTGCGKTRGLVYQTIQSFIEQGESFLVCDAKAEIMDYSLRAAQQQGYKTFVLNLREPLRSGCWNVLETLYKRYHHSAAGQHDAMDKVEDLALALFEPYPGETEPFWRNAARGIFCGVVEALFMKATIEECHLSSAYSLVITGKESAGGSSYLNYLFHQIIGVDTPAAQNASVLLNAPNDTRASLESVYVESLKLFSSYLMRDTFCRSGFDINDLKDDEKVGIYVIMPEESTKYHKIGSIFITQVFQQYVRLAHENGGRLKSRMNFLLDEFGNMFLANATSMFSAARSRNIRLFPVIQTFGQLESKYTRADADTIKNNCRLWVCFPSNHLGTLQEWSALSGTKRINSKNGTYEKPLLTIGELQAFRPRQALLRFNGMQMVTFFPDISEYADAFKGAPVKLPEREIGAVPMYDVKKCVDAFKKAQLEKLEAELEAARMKVNLSQSDTNDLEDWLDIEEIDEINERFDEEISIRQNKSRGGLEEPE